MKASNRTNTISEVKIGGISKEELLQNLEEQDVFLNDYARKLFQNPKFLTSKCSYKVQIKSLCVKELGLSQGGTTGDIFEKAFQSGLDVCPLELAPHLRLRYVDQEEGPYLTIASKKLEADDAYPNGFYLRVLDDKKWLRAYRADNDYIWGAESEFVFIVRER